MIVGWAGLLAVFVAFVHMSIALFAIKGDKAEGALRQMVLAISAAVVAVAFLTLQVLA